MHSVIAIAKRIPLGEVRLGDYNIRTFVPELSGSTTDSISHSHLA